MCGEEKNPEFFPQLNRNQSKIGHEPEAVHGSKQRFLRQALGLGLDCIIRRRFALDVHQYAVP